MTTRQRAAAIRLAATRQSAAAARAFACQTTRSWSIVVDQDTLALLVSELVTNALLHAGGDFRLALAYESDVLRVGVSDPAAHALPHTRVHSHDALATGRGLLLVDALARRWGVEREPDGKTVWFELDARPR